MKTQQTVFLFRNVTVISCVLQLCIGICEIDFAGTFISKMRGNAFLITLKAYAVLVVNNILKAAYV